VLPHITDTDNTNPNRIVEITIGGHIPHNLYKCAQPVKNPNMDIERFASYVGSRNELINGLVINPYFAYLRRYH
jgi:hypothetical protein